MKNWRRFRHFGTPSIYSFFVLMSSVSRYPLEFSKRSANWCQAILYAGQGGNLSFHFMYSSNLHFFRIIPYVCKLTQARLFGRPSLSIRYMTCHRKELFTICALITRLAFCLLVLHTLHSRRQMNGIENTVVIAPVLNLFVQNSCELCLDNGSA